MLLCSQLSIAQDNPLSVFEPLVGKTWAAAGTWGDGSIFMQEITMEWGLNKTVIKASTRGFVDADRTQIGDRNFGIRQYSKTTERIEFYEFDTFGGYTPGYIDVQGKDFYYIYEYGGTTFADIWEYLNEETYGFRVVQFDGGEIGDTYLSTEYRLKQ